MNMGKTFTDINIDIAGSPRRSGPNRRRFARGNFELGLTAGRNSV